VLWICVVVGTESYVCDQLPKLPEEPPPIGDCATLTSLWIHCADATGRARVIEQLMSPVSALPAPRSSPLLQGAELAPTIQSGGHPCTILYSTSTAHRTGRAY
jgi:hypothetical protein